MQTILVGTTSANLTPATSLTAARKTAKVQAKATPHKTVYVIADRQMVESFTFNENGKATWNDMAFPHTELFHFLNS